jgi:hypothetical protein
MTVTADTDKSGNVERVSISSQPATMLDELAIRAGMLREVCPSDAVVGFVCPEKFRLHIYLRRSEDMTRIETVSRSLSGGTFRGAHRSQAWRHSILHRVPPRPLEDS